MCIRDRSTALLFEAALGISAGLLMRMQLDYNMQLAESAVVDDQRPEHARPRSRRFPVDRPGRDVEHEIPVVRHIVVVPESGTVSDENGRRRSV